MAATAVTTIVSTHLVSGVIAIFSCMKFTKKWKIIQASIDRSLTRYTQVMINPKGIPLIKKFITYSGFTMRPDWYVPCIKIKGKCQKDHNAPKIIDSQNQFI